MATVRLLVGPVGAGKTTLAIRLAARHAAIRHDLDAWMARLYGEDPRPEADRVGWYRARVARCVAQILHDAIQALDAGVDVVLEVGLVRRAERRAVIERLELTGHAVVVYVVDAPRATRRARVEARNRDRGPTWSMDVPPPFFELASDLWEPLDAEERAAHEVRDLTP